MADQSAQSVRAIAKAKAKADKAAAKAQAKFNRAAQRAEAKADREHVKSLAKMAEDKILEDLGASLKTHARSATFACGGSLKFKQTSIDATSGGSVATTSNLHKGSTNINTDADISTAASQDTETKSTEAGSSQPPQPSKKAQETTIDAVQVRFGESGKGVHVIFSAAGVSSQDLEQLVLACQPASFGRGGEAVLDEAYRKAGKLDKEAFVTSFCPYEAGIVDVVSQLLVPQTVHDKHTRSIKAELYKLNVYSAPAGKFKSHVDTPRSEDQIGSLVVSLPAPHQGGEIYVRNAGKEMVFDWSSSNDDEATIKWAAFYSDCEHEVHEVTSGHRITLTYNLYVTRGLGHLAGSSSSLDSQQLPLYQGLKSALDTPGFLMRGRVLAVRLTHSYAHTNEHVNFLPSSLKGADMSFYNTARALGLKCVVVPTMALGWSHEGPGTTLLLESAFLGFNVSRAGGFEVDPGGGEPSWGYEMPYGKVTWLNPDRKKTKAKEGEVSKPEPPQFKEPQLAYMTYGNEPGIDIHYSRAVMFIRIPPFSERLYGKEAPKSIWEGIKRDRSEYDDYDDYDDYDEYDDEDDYDDEDPSEDEEEDEDEDEDENENDSEGGDGDGATEGVVVNDKAASGEVPQA